MQSFDAIIIGGGPAGVSAALYLVRAGLKAAIIENGAGALARAHQIDNFYGTSANGTELYAKGLEQARKLGATVINGEVVSLEYFDSYVLSLHDNKEQYHAPAVVLATGIKNITLNILGLSQLEGHGVSYCAVCDGFFFRQKRVAVLGEGAYALHEAEYLSHLASSVTILTNGKDGALAKAAGLTVNTKPLAQVVGETKIEAVQFTDGSTLPCDGLFIALGTADSTDMARKLGAEINGRFIKVNEDGATNLPGLYAAGDCTGGLLQVAKAVHDGAKAGLAALKFIRSK